MNIKKLLRIFTWFYPVFLIVLAVWGWTEYRAAAALKRDLGEISERKIEVRDEEESDGWGSEEDLQQLRSIANRWRAKSGFSAADIPVFLQETARVSGCTMDTYNSDGRVTEDAYRFETADLRVTGAFPDILRFLHRVETYPERFVRFSDIELRPVKEEKLRASLQVKVLLEMNH